MITDYCRVILRICTGSEFLLLNNGMSPEKHGAARLLRRELAYVCYEKQGFFNTKHPRVLHVAVPAMFNVNCSNSDGGLSSGSGSGEAAAVELETAECRPLTQESSRHTSAPDNQTFLLVREKKRLICSTNLRLSFILLLVYVEGLARGEARERREGTRGHWRGERRRGRERRAR